MYVTAKGDLKGMKLLIDAGSDLDASDYVFTFAKFLWIHCRLGNMSEIMASLVEITLQLPTCWMRSFTSLFLLKSHFRRSKSSKEKSGERYFLSIFDL